MESSIIYHMGCIKLHFAHNRKRIFYTSNVRVSKSVIDNKGLIRSKSLPNWQSLNEQILIHKKQIDNAILNDLRQFGNIDVSRIKETLKLNHQTAALPNTVAVDKSSMLLSDMLNDFRANQPKMNRGLRWRYDYLALILKKNDRLCNLIKTPYLHECLDKFRAGVNANTASTRYKNFKRFITWCFENGYPLPSIEWSRLSNPTFKPDFVFLTDERINELIEFNPETIFEGKIKAIFLVLIYTGMRYSDYETLKIKTEVHDGHIDKIARKTKTRFKVPIHDSIKDILQDPPRMAGQTFNKGLQALGEKLGWKELFRYRKDINEFVMVPFYDMLCSSVGRHTFATRALLNGVPHNVIMGWCGWSNSAMLFYYSEKMKLQTTDWMAKIK
jgi:integrase